MAGDIFLIWGRSQGDFCKSEHAAWLSNLLSLKLPAEFAFARTKVQDRREDELRGWYRIEVLHFPLLIGLPSAVFHSMVLFGDVTAAVALGLLKA